MLNKYIDIQVNGYAGVDLNGVSLSEDELMQVCNKLEEDNVEKIFATMISDDFDAMIKRIKNLSKLIQSNSFIKSKIAGIHVEGPFLNSQDGYRGAHCKNSIIPPALDKAKEFIEAGDGLIKLFTLAPENDKNFEVIKYLSSNNIIVSAGHSDASLDQLKGAIDNGLKMFTHLGNGAPHILDRHDNIFNRVLALADKLYIGLIGDGIHLLDFVLKNYIKFIGIERSIIVTDCMSAASAPPGKYSISNTIVEVGEDKIVREVGKKNLAGSAFTMNESEQYLHSKLGLNEMEIEKLLYENAKGLFKL